MSDVPYYIRRPSDSEADSSYSGTDGYGVLSGVGFIAAITGQLMSAVGTYYGAQSQKAQLASQASSMDYQESIANINARIAESDADAIMEAGQRQKLGLTLSHGQDRAAVKVEQASSGTAMGGRGSNAEVLASQRFLQQLDAMTLDANTVRAVNAARTRAVDIRNQGRIAGASAANLRGTAGTIDPYSSSGASLLSGLGTLASQWVYTQRYRGGRE